MKKIVRNGFFVIAVLDDGTILQNDNCTDDLFEQLKQSQSDTDAAILLLPNLQKVIEEKRGAEDLLKRVEASEYLSHEGSSIYWLRVSELSLPQNFVEKILEAEENENYDALESYKNFWTLLSLNPDERVRQNLFWYLDNWGMRISKAGLFVGYRNVDINKEGNKDYYSQELCDFVVKKYEEIRNSHKSTADQWVVLENDIYVLMNSTSLLFAERDNGEFKVKYNLREIYNELKAVNFKAENVGDDTVFTDHYTGTLKIKVGEMVTIPREDCDCDSDVECSRGLHLGGTTWLQQCYFGDVGLACLCNPRDVVAIPRDANYGKLRTCAYLPVARVEYDETGHVIPLNVEDGFESKWVKTILYDGIMATEDSPLYRITVPDIPELNKSWITEKVLEIARKYMK